MKSLFVNGIVSSRDQEPYIQLSSDEGMIAQLPLADARSFAEDILQMASRTEMDALVLKFLVEKTGTPIETAAAVMNQFREYRARWDENYRNAAG